MLFLKSSKFTQKPKIHHKQNSLHRVNKTEFNKFSIHLDNWLNILVHFLLCNYSDLSKTTFCYLSRVTQVLSIARSAKSATLLAGLSCSFVSLDTVRLCTGNNFSTPLINFAATNRWFWSLIVWWNSASPIVRFCTSRKYFLSTFLEILSFTSN